MTDIVDYWYWLNGASGQYRILMADGSLYAEGVEVKGLPHPSVVQRCYQDEKGILIWLTNGVQFRIEKDEDEIQID